jgi:SAM-dependent methyltransferase
MNKYVISSMVRKLGLIKLFDYLLFFIAYLSNYNIRRKFYKENPQIILPPAYYIYETFNLNYYSFYNKSIETAEWLVSFFKKYKTLEELNVLDWGCGPGRVIRHLPSLMGSSCKFYGTDYNEKYIKWCHKYLSDVTFSLNKLNPPLKFEDNTFDIIYGISIFTHLSKDMHYAWFNELVRVLKPEGIIFLTLHGEIFKSKLTDKEKDEFDKGNIVIKAKTKEGHRTFAAFQPESFVKELIGGNELLEHIPGVIKDGKPKQDIWIIKKQ